MVSVAGLHGDLAWYTYPGMASRYNHAKQLRTIGQELDKRAIDIFELRHDKGDYHLECADPEPPFTDLIHLDYSSDDLVTLELSAAQGRTAGFKQVDFDSLAEILRAMGRHVERLDAELLRISLGDNDGGRSFKVEYQLRDGRRHIEEMLTSSITDLAMRMYKDRGNSKGTWDNRLSPDNGLFSQRPFRQPH